MSTFITDPFGNVFSLSLNTSGQLTWEPAVEPPPPPPPPSSPTQANSGAALGFKRSQIIDAAHKRTDGRAKSLDVEAEYALALQEVALENRWWWRRKIVPFTITAGAPTYQLSGTSGIGMSDFQQAALNGFKIYGPGTGFSCPDPVFDIDVQDTIIGLQSLAPPGRPTRYFIVGAPGEMRVDPVPDANYSASLAHWSIPLYVAGGEDEVVTNVPAYLHALLIKRLEMHFCKSLLTEEPNKYKAVVAEYAELLGNASLYRNFSEGQVRSFANGDSNDSIRSA